MILNINDKQALILKSLLEEEIQFLETEAIPDTPLSSDKKELQEDLDNCKNILKQLNN